MDQESREAGSEVAQGERTPEQIQAEIDATRQQLGETVAAVVEKTDIKGQAREKVEEVKQTAQAKKEDLFAKAKSSSPDSASTGAQQIKTKAQDNPLPLAIAAALVVGFALGRRGSR